MKVLITGVNGMLGGNTARILLGSGYQVRGLTRRQGPFPELAGMDIEQFTGSIHNPDEINRAVRGCEVVIHAAANTRQFPTEIRHYQESNIDGTRCVVQACKRYGVKRLIYVGTANSFGHSSPERPADENSAFNFNCIASGYIHSKYIAQQEVLREARISALPAVVVNPAFLIGAGGSDAGSGRIVSGFANKRVILCPPGSKNFIYVKDAAVGIKNAIQKGGVGQCYILGNQNLSYRQFFQKVLFRTGHRALLLPIPEVLLMGLGKAVKLMQSLIPFHFPLNDVNAKLLCTHLCYSPEKAVRELSLPQTPIEHAIGENLNRSVSPVKKPDAKAKKKMNTGGLQP